MKLYVAILGFLLLPTTGLAQSEGATPLPDFQTKAAPKLARPMPVTPTTASDEKNKDAAQLKKQPRKGTSNTPSASEVSDWAYSVALVGFAIASFTDEPSEANKFADLGGARARVPYSGFAGVGGGGGLTIEALWKGVIGIEVGLWNASESAEGKLDIIDYSVPGGAGNRYELTFNKSSWHLPVSVKLAAPTKTVKPYLLVGGDFIFPSSAEVETEFGGTMADDRSYQALHFGFGFDFGIKLETVELKIPFTLRGNYNLGLGDGVGERIKFNGCNQTGAAIQCSGYTYRTDWQYQALITLGLGIIF